MSTTTDPAADTAGHANAGDTANAGTSDIDAKINKAIGNWMKRLEAKIPQLVESKLEALVQEGQSTQKPEPQRQQDASAGASDPARLNMKALENQINELKQQLLKRDEAIEQKEQQRIDALMRSQVREGLASVLGADNPNLGLAMDSLYDARKRFVAGQDGSPLVKFKGEYGSEDDHLPLKEGLKKLAESELKHLMPSKTQGLPPVGPRRGNPVPTNGTSGPSPIDRIFGDVMSQIPRSTAADPTQK